RLLLFAAMTLTFVLGIERLGLLGTIAVVVAVQVLGTAAAAVRLSLVMALRKPDFAPFAVLGRIGAAAIAAGVVCAAVRWAMLPADPPVVLMVCGLFYAIAYWLAIVAVRVVDRDDYAVLRGLVNRGPMAPRRTVLAEARNR